MRRDLAFVSAVALAVAGCKTVQKNTPPLLKTAPVQDVQPEPTCDMETVSVGVVLPLSGPKAALGQTLLKGIRVALHEGAPFLKAVNKKVTLDIVDSCGSASKAAVGVRGLEKRGAAIIIGPAPSDELAAAVEKRRTQAPLLTFANQNNLLSAERGVFGLRTPLRHGFLAMRAVLKVCKNPILFLPDTKRGQDFARLVQQDALPIALVFYKNVQGAWTFARVLEGAALVWEAVPPYLGDASVVFVADAGLAFHNIVAFLRAENALQTQTVASVVPWEEAAVPISENVAWIGAETQRPADGLRAHGRTLFGALSDDFLLGYDALAFVQQKILDHGDGWTEDLCGPNPFFGMSGTFVFLPDGTSRRTLRFVKNVSGRPTPWPEGAV